MEIQILGSVSPNCNGDRNGISYLVSDDRFKILLDCGDGSTRLWNTMDLNNTIIIISHYHKDHYMGLLSLGNASYIDHNVWNLKERVKVFIPEPNYVLTPNIYDYNLKGVKVPIIDYQYLTNFGNEHYMEFITYNQNTKLKVGNMDISFVKTIHEPDTYACKIEDGTNTFVYSADTGYHNNPFGEFAKDADMFICESTFLKDQKKSNDIHLSAYEAAMIAKEASVKQLVLTHFYPYIDKQLYLNEAKEIFDNTIVAEEGKVLRLVK